MECILSLDLGTTAIKVMLFAKDGSVLGKSTQEYTLLTPTALAVELDPEVYWKAFKAGVQEVMSVSGVSPKDIKALGISAQGETLITLGADHKPLMNAIVWLDNRAQEEADILGDEFGHEHAYRITGQVKIVPTWPASKILWLKRNNPEVYKNAAKYLLIEDYFIYRMTGKFVCEGSLVCSTVYWDIIKKTWWKEMLDYLGVSEQQLPELMEPGQTVGQLLPEVAAELGLSSETMITTGALDQACGAIGVGNIKPGVISENTGAALAICATVDKPFFDPQGMMPCHYHAIPDTYMAHTFTTGGMTLKWFRDAFCQSEGQVAQIAGLDAYDLMGKEADSVPPGADGLIMLPHLAGAMAPESNPLAKGVFYGFTLHHTKPYFIRAVMESIACIVKRNIDVLNTLGIDVKEIRSLGGGSRSRVWNQIKADVTQKSVFTMKNEEAASLGAAILAGTAVGIYPSLEKACNEMVSLRHCLQPRLENRAVYEKTYEKYLMLYDSLVEMFKV
ncbi:FGGY-family carbohydrate kinase [Petroclostridium sp. X23]|uniref:xylulokinase n=1 Tax=Petroclostridium sp. X23 TaxID=3045146 RepID=UPI0024ACF55B|nr:FGGY-family carbohydrate kinase [Petroclostridium sp. X23]WHH60483.1 FGGY-family carbohydrate kinase [Petroclostridium sp. X23]